MARTWLSYGIDWRCGVRFSGMYCVIWEPIFFLWIVLHFVLSQVKRKGILFFPRILNFIVYLLLWVEKTLETLKFTVRVICMQTFIWGVDLGSWKSVIKNGQRIVRYSFFFFVKKVCEAWKTSQDHVVYVHSFSRLLYVHDMTPLAS